MSNTRLAAWMPRLPPRKQMSRFLGRAASVRAPKPALAPMPRVGPFRAHYGESLFFVVRAFRA